MSDLRKVLCVEDEPDLQEVIGLALETVGGLTVESCGSGPKALERVKPFGPDLILLDVMMPGMDGLATLEALRADPETAHIPVVFMTAKVQPDELAEYRRAGALDAIAKPFDPMTLADKLRALHAKAP
jgi:CheY-like chemotaxis protein